MRKLTTNIPMLSDSELIFNVDYYEGSPYLGLYIHFREELLEPHLIPRCFPIDCAGVAFHITEQTFDFVGKLLTLI